MKFYNQYRIYCGCSSPCKVYTSGVIRTPLHDVWELHSYYFPCAEKIARIKGGWYILKAYLWIRMTWEDIWSKRRS